MGKSYQTSFSKQGPPPSSNSSLLDVLLNSVESRAGLAEAGSKTTSRPPLTGPSLCKTCEHTFFFFFVGENFIFL